MKYSELSKAELLSLKEKANTTKTAQPIINEVKLALSFLRTSISSTNGSTSEIRRENTIPVRDAVETVPHVRVVVFI